jgi:hypothetical protein
LGGGFGHWRGKTEERKEEWWNCILN